MAAREINEYLSQIDQSRELMVADISRWCAFNAYTYNPAGVERLVNLLAEDFADLGAEIQKVPVPPARIIDAAGEEIDAPLGPALIITKRPQARRRVLLAIHTDTVFPPEHPFQKVTRESRNILRGPGVMDARGGIAIILQALRTLERYLAENPESNQDAVGWRVILNPDEEIGSPGSAELLSQAAREYDFGLLFEPALPDGALVDARRGSGNFNLVIRGRAAHVGREFEKGRSAMHLAAEIISRIADLNRVTGITANVGRLDGGGPVNVVADLAIARFNLRVEDETARTLAETHLQALLADVSGRDGYELRLHGAFNAPPKPFEGKTRALMAGLVACAREEGLELSHRPTGGVCDGNRLFAAGLPNIDTLGARGGGAHSAEEYLEVDGLVERARLTARLLLKYTRGEFEWKR